MCSIYCCLLPWISALPESNHPILTLYAQRVFCEILIRGQSNWDLQGFFVFSDVSAILNCFLARGERVTRVREHVLDAVLKLSEILALMKKILLRQSRKSYRGYSSISSNHRVRWSSTGLVPSRFED
jgi:hypothetical protein